MQPMVAAAVAATSRVVVSKRLAQSVPASPSASSSFTETLPPMAFTKSSDMPMVGPARSEDVESARASIGVVVLGVAAPAR